MRIISLVLASLAGLWLSGAPLTGCNVAPVGVAPFGVAWAVDNSVVPPSATPGSKMQDGRMQGANFPGVSSLGIFGDWQAKTVSQQGVTLCYASSTPSHGSPVFTGRGSSGLLVTHAERGMARDQVSVALGFIPRKGTSVSLKIGQHNFTLQKIDGDRAWSSSDTQDRQIVAAMKVGDTVLMRATTTDGRTGEDRYSLSGFQAAYNKIADACGL